MRNGISSTQYIVIAKLFPLGGTLLSSYFYINFLVVAATESPEVSRCEFGNQGKKTITMKIDRLGKNRNSRGECGRRWLTQLIAVFIIIISEVACEIERHR